MDYYKLLQLEREPFSNSPDPEFFFQSRQHRGCLQKLELALRLKRGLNIVMGDIGSGKTTLCREIIRKFAAEPEFETHLILDPAFTSTTRFVSALYCLLCTEPAPKESSLTDLKEAIKQNLFRKGVDQNRTVILIIDEGQKITPPCIELLRELLNYETNTFKLLQIVIFAQEEFRALLVEHPNFADRVNLLHHLGPLDFKDTRRLIRHRLKLASSRPRPIEPFTLPALWAIYRYSRGFPRRIIHLCHQSIMAMIIQNRTRAGWLLVRACLQRGLPERQPARRSRAAIIAIAAAALLLVLGLNFYPDLLRLNLFKNGAPTLSALQPAAIPPVASPQPVPEKKAPPEIALQAVPPNTIAPLEPLQQEPTPAAPESGPKPDETAQTDVEEASAARSDLPMPPEIQKSTTPPAAAFPPDDLGQTRINAGDTLYHMIATIYGSYRNEYMHAVLSSNPQISNPDSIKYGSAVNFPALRFAAPSAALPAHWVVVAQYPSLQPAFQEALKLKRQTGLLFRLLTTWSPSQALTFHLVCGGAVSDPKSAGAIVATLPATLAARTQIVDRWPDDVEFYADPNISAATFENRPDMR